jgi:WD40 repeat protein
MLRKSAWQRAFDWIFGYDLFISYSRLGWDERYAVGLAEQLSRSPYDFKCFLDAKSLETGYSWRLQGRRALRKSSKIILLLTPGVLLSPGVRDELEYNNSLGSKRKSVSFVNIQEAWTRVATDTDFVKLLEIDGSAAAESLRIQETELHKPSASVLERIKNDFKMRTENSKRVYVLAISATVLLIFAVAAAALAVTAVTWSLIAREQRAAAVASKNDALTRESYFRAEQTKQVGADAVAASLLALEGLPDPTSADDDQRTRPFVNEPWSALYAARHEIRERTILSGHTGGVTSASFAPSGDRILTTSSWDGTARLWDSDGKLRAILSAGAKMAMFSPGGDRILTASEETARLWDRDGKPLATLQGHTGEVRSAVFSHDGERILTASMDDTARLWGRDGNPIAILEGHEGSVVSAVFSLDGSRILTASDDRTARLWDRDGKPLSTLTDHSQGGANFSPDGRILTVWDNTAQLWDGDGKLLATLTGHTKNVVSAVFSPDGDRAKTESW